MNKKIPFQNRILAFLISILFIFALFFSFFALPVELKLFNPLSYSALVTQDEYLQVLPSVISETLVFQAAASKATTQIDLTANKDTISSIIARYIPVELVQSTFDDVIGQMFSYFNFRIPTVDLKVNITDLKTQLATSSSEIGEEFLATLPNCQDNALEGLNLDSNLTIQDLPVCTPAGKNLDQFERAWGMAFEDMFNRLPSSISLANVIAPDQNLPDRYFNTYSLVRWGFRLLPIVTILLLILVAVLLRNQRDVMWKWCGRLLIIVSGVTLLALVILMIGFDQFIAMLLNPLLKNMISGFGSVLLGAVQDVGFQMIILVIISALVVMGFGIMLLLAGKFVKPAAAAASTIEVQAESEPVEIPEEIPAEEPAAMQKTVIPETLEEVEQAEKRRKKNKKNDQE
jgi:hypothetical protein